MSRASLRTLVWLVCRNAVGNLQLADIVRKAILKGEQKRYLKSQHQYICASQLLLCISQNWHKQGPDLRYLRWAHLEGGIFWIQENKLAEGYWVHWITENQWIPLISLVSLPSPGFHCFPVKESVLLFWSPYGLRGQIWPNFCYAQYWQPTKFHVFWGTYTALLWTLMD